MQIFEQCEPIISAGQIQSDIIGVNRYTDYLCMPKIQSKDRNWTAFRAFDMECQLNYQFGVGKVKYFETTAWTTIILHAWWDAREAAHSLFIEIIHYHPKWTVIYTLYSKMGNSNNKTFKECHCENYRNFGIFVTKQFLTIISPSGPFVTIKFHAPAGKQE